MVSISDLNAEGPGNTGVGKENLVIELVNIYLVSSCSFVEIMRLCVVSVGIN